MNTFKTQKGTELPLLDLRGKKYLQVAHRIVWFREEHPDWSIETDVKRLEGAAALGHAVIKDSTGRIIATGHKYEDAKGFPDYIEKAETGAIGRALGFIGYGTQFAPELEEGERLVDSPIGRTERAQESNSVGTLDLWTYRVPVGLGKNAGKLLRELAPEEIQKSLDYWLTRETNEKRPLTGKPKEFVQAAAEFLRKEDSPPSGHPADLDVPF